MPRVEIKSDMNAKAKTIYDILMNDDLEAKWNLTVNETQSIGPDKWEVKSTIGDLTSTRVEAKENERITFDIEGSIFNRMGYILKPKGNTTKVVGWGEFEDEKNKKMLESAGGILLESLKRFAEYVEEGGDPEEFNKKALTITP
ncbi:MAG: hypothetical protein ACFE94_15180 [Candidatus Hodarchaeota archaeon]